MSDKRPDYIDGYKRAHMDDRLAAFAAIRRAAYQARMFDRSVAYMEKHGIVTNQSMQARGAAMGIRRAIRAAIGSEKN